MLSLPPSELAERIHRREEMVSIGLRLLPSSSAMARKRRCEDCRRQCPRIPLYSAHLTSSRGSLQLPHSTDRFVLLARASELATKLLICAQEYVLILTSSRVLSDGCRARMTLPLSLILPNRSSQAGPRPLERLLRSLPHLLQNLTSPLRLVDEANT